MREDFSGGTNLTLRLTGWKREMEGALAGLPGIDDIRVEACGDGEDGVRVYLAVSGMGDLRARLSRLVVEQGCGLLEMGEEGPALEDVFRTVTRDRGEVRV